MNAEVYKPEKLYEGTVAQYFDRGGYGFISCPDFAQHVFAHVSHVRMTQPAVMMQGELVEFQVVQGLKGLCAVNITPKVMNGTHEGVLHA